MKRLIYVAIFFCVAACSNEYPSSKISITAPDFDFIMIKNPIDDITLWDYQTDTIYPNEKNEFLFQKKIEHPEFVSVIIGKKYIKSILIPGQEFSINASDRIPIFEGTNATGIELLNDFKRPFFSMNESNKYQKDSTALQVKKKITSLKQAEIQQLESLLIHEKIDASFGSILKQEIDYFYAQRTAQIVMAKQYSQTNIANDLLQLLEETLKTYPLQTNYKASSWAMYAETILQEKATYDALKKGTITTDSLQQYYATDRLHPFYYDVIATYKDATISEKVAAAYIMNNAKQNKFEKSLISLYEQFNHDFPNSIYTKYLEKDIEKIKEYHVKVSRKMPDDVMFYANENIASLEELAKDLQGDNYYVDVWATWCGPCKRAFKHNESLGKLLKEKGYKKLYISLDKPAQRKKWEQDIKYFDLSGLHVLASKAFFIDFEKKYSLHEGYVSIPQYLIIDKNGTIVTNNAARPSDLETLSIQLNP